MGATRKLVLSPTPPVECLSTAILPRRAGENFSPESRMARVSARVSSSERPRRKAAISHAESCSGGNRSVGSAGDQKADLACVE